MSVLWVDIIVMLPMNVATRKDRSDVTDPGTLRPFQQLQQLQHQLLQLRLVVQYHNKRYICHHRFIDTIHQIPMIPLNITEIMNMTDILHRVILGLKEMCRELVLVSVEDAELLFYLLKRTNR